MKPMKTLITILFISLLSSHSWSVTFDDLVERDGLYYEKFTDVPYNGKATGEEQGSFKSGKREGAWVFYHENGQAWLEYNYKNGSKEGAWVSDNEDGTVDKELTRPYKDGVKIR
jgi:antitoxin component YwqK of YwqJK toxin-antitoxin module